MPRLDNSRNPSLGHSALVDAHLRCSSFEVFDNQDILHVHRLPFVVLPLRGRSTRLLVRCDWRGFPRLTQSPVVLTGPNSAETPPSSITQVPKDWTESLGANLGIQPYRLVRA